MNLIAKEGFFVVLRWLGMVGTFVCFASAAGTLALGSMYGSTHIFLAVWVVLGMTFLALWVIAARKLRQNAN